MTNEKLSTTSPMEGFVPPMIAVEPLDDPYYIEGEVPVDEDEVGIVPPTVDQAAAVADIYNLAGAHTKHGAVTPADVMARLAGRTTSPTLDAINGSIAEESDAMTKQAQQFAIADPSMSVQERLDVVDVLESDAEGPDYNRVQRRALENVVFAENWADDSEDSDATAEAATDNVEYVPKNIELASENENPEEVREGYLALLNWASTKANEGANLSTAGGWADFATSAIPGRETGAVAKIYTDLGLHDASVMGVGGTILMGEALRQIREHVKTLGTEQKVEALGTILRTLMPNAGMFKDGNDWLSAHVLNEVFHEELTGEPYDGVLDDIISGGSMVPKEQRMLKSDASITSAVDNATSLLDIAAVGGVARATIRGGFKYLPNSLKMLDKASPDAAARTWGDVFSDPAVRAKFGGLVGEDIMEAVLPSASHALREGGVNGMQEMIIRQLDARDRLMRISGSSNYTQVERATAWEELTKGFTDVAGKATGNLHVNQTVFKEAGDGVEISAVFGRTPHKGWGTLGSAQRAGRDSVDTLFGTDTPIQIMMKDKKGKLVEVPAGTPATARGSFFVQAADKRAYEAAPTTFHQLVFDAKDVRNLRWSPSAWLAPLARKVGLDWVNPSSTFGKSIIDPIATQGFSKTAWNKLSYGLLNEVRSLDGKQQNILASVIKSGEKVKTTTGRGKVFSPTELKAQGLNDKGVLAYYGYRNAADILWGVSNQTVRNQWFREGTKELVSKTGRVGFGKPLATVGDALSDIKTHLGSTGLDVFDVATSTYKRLSTSDIDTLYKSGGSLARLRTVQLGKGGDEATHILLGEKSGTRVAELPRSVLTKVEGYYPHMWKGNYVVHGTTKAGSRIVVGMASNQFEASKIVKSFNASLATKAAKGKKTRFKNDSFSYTADKSLDNTYGRAAAVEDQFVNWGGPVFGHRNGGTIRNLSKADGDIMVDPIEGLLQGMEIVGRQVTTGNLVANMRQKLFNFASSEGILKNAREIPRTADDLVNSAGKDKAYLTAREYLHQIDLTERIPDQWRQLMGESFSRASAALASLAELGIPGAKRLSKMASDRARDPIDPAGIMMGWLHRKAIAASPVAQFALQASQSMVMLGIAPKHYSASLARLSGVMALVGEKTMYLEQGLLKRSFSFYEKELPKLAKVLGYSPEELGKLVDIIIEKGVVSSTSYHTMMRSSVRSAAEGRMKSSAASGNRGRLSRMVGNAVRGTDAATFGVASKIGFEGGENVNKILTFLTMYGRDKAKGAADLASPDYVRSLIGEVSEVSGSMIPELSFGYQRGFLKNAFQFVSFQHKMMMLMWPAALGGSRRLSGKEKAGMVLAQSLLFGRRAAAHTDMLYRTVDTVINDLEASSDEKSELAILWNDPRTHDLMDGLIADTGTNYILREVFGSETELDISGRFAPGGGSEFIAERVAAVASLNPDEMFGISGKNSSQLYQYMKRVHDISLAQATGMDDIPVGERMKEIFEGAAANTIGTYNRILALRMAQKMDGWVSSGGVISESYTGGLEEKMFLHFGVNSKDRASLYEAMDKYERELSMTGTKKEQELSELSNQYYKNLIASSVKHAEDSGGRDDIYNTLQARWTREQGLLFSSLDPEEAEYVSRNVNERIRKAIINPDSQEKAFVEKLIKPIVDGKFGSDGPKALNYLRHAHFVESNPRLVQIVHDAWEESMAEGEE